MKKLLFSLLLAAIFVMVTTGAWAANDGVVKWSQPPDMEFGVNIQSTEVEPIIADDWKCRDPRPVTDVHFWGSYIMWEETNPNPVLPEPEVEGFWIHIYKDVPATPDDYSHPGELLYEVEVKEFEQRYVDSIPHPNETYEHKFYYSLDLPTPFDQQEGTIYWISIAAIMPPTGYDFPWGWETSKDHWNDNACGSVSGQEPWYWYEITPGMLPEWYPHERVDMAFELTVPSEPPPPLEPVKWQQRPDMVQGVNVISNPEIDPPSILTVADDWLCLDGSPVSDLHFWGSYPGWEEQNPEPPAACPPGVKAFRIQIYSDAPAVSPELFSRPDKLLYEVWVKEPDFTETYEATIPQPWWDIYEHKYRYNLDLPRIFFQKRDKIYWLNISAIPNNPDFLWGWESSMDRWNDAAVKGWYKDPTPGNSEWEPIIHPWTKEFIDMSFELTTCEGPIKWLQFPDMANGFNIGSLPMDPVVADDFLCTDGKEITEVHFWGSYIDDPYEPGKHWQQQAPVPLLPTPGLKTFKLSFHKDIPAGVDPNMPWSHPGELIREVWVDFEKVKERYWDSVPHTDPQGVIWWEHKFYYIVRLERPFEQEEGKIYWLDIGAVPRELGTEPTWYWGWETSKDHWNDNAVRGWEDGWWWEDLGQIYGSPIDMAFLLITEDYISYCECDLNRDGRCDMQDWLLFGEDWGRTDCYSTGDCECDLNYDGRCDMQDWLLFGEDWGRTDCPCPLN